MLFETALDKDASMESLIEIQEVGERGRQSTRVST